MTLARRIGWQIGALSVGLLFATGGVLWSMRALQRLSEITHEEFEELREVRLCEKHVADAFEDLIAGDTSEGATEIQRALDYVREFLAYQDSEKSALGEQHASMERTLAARALTALQDLHVDDSAAKAASSTSELGDIQNARAALTRLGDEIGQTVARAHEQVADRFRFTLWSMVGLFAGMVTLGLVLGRHHYRSIVRPLHRLRDGARRMAAGELRLQIEAGGDTEFADLQRDFNHMARELRTVYENLERRVAEQSKQLARSERLASIGYLAAGVAHEINNPLAIISGYAESVLRQVGAQTNGHTVPARLLADLKIVQDEAFRCKRITDGLLDLSRLGDQQRDPLSMRKVIDDVVGLVRSTPLSRDRAIEVGANGEGGFCVMGSAPEMKQVVLNLVMNALRAVPPGGGRVELLTEEREGWFELRVCDNGCGMSAETTARIFEPFYSENRNQSGVGLGLTISQAIVERHGGTLSAESLGAGKGSVFTLRIPLCSERVG